MGYLYVFAIFFIFGTGVNSQDISLEGILGKYDPLFILPDLAFDTEKVLAIPMIVTGFLEINDMWIEGFSNVTIIIGMEGEDSSIKLKGKDVNFQVKDYKVDMHIVELLVAQFSGMLKISLEDFEMEIVGSEDGGELKVKKFVMPIDNLKIKITNIMNDGVISNIVSLVATNLVKDLYKTYIQPHDTYAVERIVNTILYILNQKSYNLFEVLNIHA